MDGGAWWRQSMGSLRAGHDEQLTHHYQSLLRLTSTAPVMPSHHLILCRPLLFPPSIFSSIRVFSNESALLIWWPKYWSFSMSPSSEYSGLISFGMDWLDLLAVHGTLKSLLQRHSSKASVYWCSAFFMAQLSHSYMTTGDSVSHQNSTTKSPLSRTVKCYEMLGLKI